MGAVQLDTSMLPDRPGALEQSLRFDNILLPETQHERHARRTVSSGKLKDREERQHKRRGRPRSSASEGAVLPGGGAGGSLPEAAGLKADSTAGESTQAGPATSPVNPPSGGSNPPAHGPPRQAAAHTRARSRMVADTGPPEPRSKIWGMPPFYAEDAESSSQRTYGKETAPGVKLITSEELAELVHLHETADVPSSVLFPWLHGIGDGPNGAQGGALEEFFGYPSCAPPPFRGLTIMRVPTPLLDRAGEQKQEPISIDTRRAGEGAASTDDAEEGSPASIGMERDATLQAREGATQSRSSTPVPCGIACPQPASWDAMRHWSATPAARSEVSSGGDYSSSTDHSARERSASYSTTVSTSSSSEMSSDPSFLSLSPSQPRGLGFSKVIWGRGPAAIIGEQDPPEEINEGYSPPSSLASSFYAPGWRADDSKSRGSMSEAKQGFVAGVALDDQPCMHPTASKSKTSIAGSPSPSSGLLQQLQASNAALQARGAIHFALTSNTFADEAQVPPRPSSASPSISSYQSLLLDAAPMQRSRSTGPLSTHTAPTPKVSTSPDPSDPKSGLRSVSTPGRSRNHSPVPSRPGTPRHKGPAVSSSANVFQESAPASPASAGKVDNKAVTESAVSDGQAISYPKSLLLNASKLEDLVDIKDNGGGGMRADFKKPQLAPEVSLRNLNIQEIKYTTVSDIVLYAPVGTGDSASRKDRLIALAQCVADAQRRTAEARRQLKQREEADGTACPADEVNDKNACEVRYGVYVLQDSFADLQAKLPGLVGTDGDGRRRDSLDLSKAEIDESLEFSGATEIAAGIWLGNAYDNPFRDGAMINDPPPYDLVIEAHDSACNPSADVLSALKRALSEYKHRTRNPSFKLRDILGSGCSSAPAPIIGECISSSKSYGCHGQTVEQTATGLIAVVELVKRFVGDRVLSRSDGSRSKPKVLVYCDDGYTETSLFALTYLVVSQRLTLSQAYLHLHLHAKRNFFVYPFDIGLLLRIERKVSERSEPGSPPPSPSKSLQHGTRWKPWGLGFSRNSGAGRVPDATEDDAHASEDKAATTLSTDRRWLTSSHFDGSLPSQLIPCLYLGHLDHASNPRLLKALGITHVVSVGEPILVESIAARDHYVWRNTCPTAEDIAQHGGSKIEVLEMSGIKDDGNDPLRPKIDLACEYIDRARQVGGKTLVHCRVGVSRSATICIAYLMKHHDMSLMKAYLLTRARRLNVLIQPNLRFLHELLGWEVQLRSEALDGGDDTGATPRITDDASGASGDSRHGHAHFTWPHLCKAIDQLNKRYLSPQT